MNQNDLLPVRSIGFGEAIRNFFIKYAVFSGRATRKEFWYAMLFQVVVMALLSGPSYEKFPITGILGTIFSWGTLIPGLAVTFRRLHDTGKSGWNLLFNLIPVLGNIMFLIMLCLGSEPDNDYGPRIV